MFPYSLKSPHLALALWKTRDQKILGGLVSISVPFPLPLPSQNLHQGNSGEPLLTFMCSPGETPNACTYITLSGLSFYFKMKGPFFNFKKSSCSHQKNFKAKPHLCLLSFPLKKPLFFTQEYLALEMVKVSDALLDLRRKYQQNRENQGRRCRKSHDWQRGFDYSVSHSPLTSEHTQAHSDSPSRSKDKSRMKAGFLSGDS